MKNDFLHRLTHKIRTEKGEMSLSYLVAIDAKTLVSQKDIVHWFQFWSIWLVLDPHYIVVDVEKSLGKFYSFNLHVQIGVYL